MSVEDPTHLACLVGEQLDAPLERSQVGGDDDAGLVAEHGLDGSLFVDLPEPDL
jgi:hypothetical protein